MESIPDKTTPLLVVDDDQGLLLSIRSTLLSAGLPEPALASDSRRVFDLVRTHDFKVILLDLVMPHIGGLELLRQINEVHPNIACIVVTAIDQATAAVQAMNLGAFDYLVKPLSGEKLTGVINHALERFTLNYELSLLSPTQSFAQLKNPEAFIDIIAEDEAMAFVFRQVETVAPTDYSVIINGESGTGKEMLARAIHRLSRRAPMPFLAVNMAAVSKTIFEDEFFGHAKGAFTDAVSDKRGFFEAAGGGTLFLDEVTELEPSLQGKLLRVIEEREFYRLGSTEVRSVDVRIVAATNRDITAEIEGNRFRADLFYRLNMYNIKVPPLRERKKDILPLARHFTRLHADANRKPITTIDAQLARSLAAYSFPGNVRELEHIIAGAVLREQGSVLTLSSAPELAATSASAAKTGGGFLTLEELEKRHIHDVLDATGGNRARAAEILGINTSTVYRKIEKYGLEEHREKQMS
ncbi:MAG: sigma-54 dependent transcriptional regulator [Desulfobacterales bacterium]